MLDELRGRMLAVTTADIRASIATNKDHGSPDSLTSAMYGAEFAAWHQEAGRLRDQPAVNVYEMGVLYGMQLYDDLHYKKTGVVVRADDPDAYRVATATVRGSYELPLLPDGLPRWQVEKHRDMAYTGNDLLSILNAGVHDHVMRQYSQLYDQLPPSSQLSGEAFYMGLIDASIFSNTYARFKAGRGPQKFPLAVTYARPVGLAGALAQTLERHDGLHGMTFELEPTDELGQMVEAMHPSLDAAQWSLIELNGATYRVLSMPVMRQHGDNEFARGHDILQIIPYGDAIDTVLGRVVKRLGVSALAGMAVGTVVDGVMRLSSDWQQMPRLDIAGAALGTWLGYAVFTRLEEHRQRKREVAADAEAEQLQAGLSAAHDRLMQHYRDQYEA
jgi:hypothetical protein